MKVYHLSSHAQQMARMLVLLSSVLECSTNDVAAASLIDQADRTLNGSVEADLTAACLHDLTFW